MAAFSLSSVPPSIILALGQAFSVKDPEGMSQSEHYDLALLHLMTHWSGDPIDPESGVPRLAVVMKHVPQLMDAKTLTVPATVAKGTQHPNSNVAPVEEPEAPPPPPEVKKRLTADGFMILEFRHGDMLTTDQARERAG